MVEVAVRSSSINTSIALRSGGSAIARTITDVGTRTSRIKPKQKEKYCQ